MRKWNAIVLSSFLILVGVIVLLLCGFVLPNLAEETVRHSPEVAYLQYPILLGMYATAIPFFYAIYATVDMIFTIERESIFSHKLSKSLTHIKYCAMTIITLYILGFFILDASNALPPLVAVLGISIIVISSIVATASTFIKHAISKESIIA